MHQMPPAATQHGPVAPQRPRLTFYAVVGCLSLLAGLVLGVGGFVGVRALQDGGTSRVEGAGEGSSAAPLVLEETPLGKDAAVPLGTTFPIRSAALGGDPDVTPVSVDWDATAEVAEANSYNDVPDPDHKYIVLSVDGHLEGEGPDTTLLVSWVDVLYVAPDGTQYEQDWSVTPGYEESIGSAGTAEDGSFTAEFCFEVPSGTEPGGHFVFGDGMGSLDGWAWVAAA